MAELFRSGLGEPRIFRHWKGKLAAVLQLDGNEPISVIR